MATSGLIQGTVTQKTSIFRAYIYWEEINDWNDRVQNNRALVKITPLVDTTSTSESWDGTVRDMILSINNVSNSYENFESDSYSGYTYSASNSPTGRAAENIMEGLSTPYYTVYVTYDSEGKITNLPLSCSFSLPSAGYGPGDVSISGTIDLEPMPFMFTLQPNDTSTTTDSATIRYRTNRTITAAKYTAVSILPAHTVTSDWISLSGKDITQVINGLHMYKSYFTTIKVKSIDNEELTSDTFGIKTKRSYAYAKNTSWKSGTVYLKVNGSWVPALPYVKVSGTWKKGSTETW